jgi:serine/threonine protein kinase
LDPTEIHPPRQNEEPDLGFLAPRRQAGELGRLGPYRVIRVLGRGGMGVVFLADDPALKRAVALKVMLPSIAAKPTARVRFLREARAAAGLEHDHIVPIYQVGEEGGVPFIAMPLLKGMTLEDYLRRRGRLTLPQILRVGREVAKGLAAAHDKGLVHRDIKPANLWLDAMAAGRVKILDFGLARAAEGDEHLTHEGAVVGTPAFMSPEQASGKTVGPASDLFSLGSVLYLLCTGRRPFAGSTPFAVLTALATEAPTPVVELNPDTPLPLAELVHRLLNKNPARRPASAREVAEAIYAMERKRLVEKLEQEAAAGLNTPGASQTVNLNPEESADSQIELAQPIDPPARSRSPRISWLLAGSVAAVAALVVSAALAAGVALTRWPKPVQDGVGAGGPTAPDPPKYGPFRPPPPGQGKKLIPAKNLSRLKDAQAFQRDPAEQWDLALDGDDPVVTSTVKDAALYFGGRVRKNYYLRFEYQRIEGFGAPSLSFYDQYHKPVDGGEGGSGCYLWLNGSGMVSKYGPRRFARATWDGKSWRSDGPASEQRLRNPQLKPEPCWHTGELYAVDEVVVPIIDGQILGAVADIQDRVGGNWVAVSSGGIHFRTGEKMIAFRRVEFWDCDSIPDDVKALCVAEAK